MERKYKQKIRGSFDVTIDGIVKIKKDNHLTFQGVSYLFQHLLQPYPCSLSVNTPPTSFTMGALTGTSISDNDTYASHSGWSLNSNFQTNPLPWTPDYPQVGKLSNLVPVTFFPTATTTIFGFAIFGSEVFITPPNVEMIWSIMAFNTPVTVNSNQVINVTYTIGLDLLNLTVVNSVPNSTFSEFGS